MLNTIEVLDFVNKQVEIQEKLAHKFKKEKFRENLHLESASKFKAISDFISSQQQKIEELQNSNKVKVKPGFQLNLSFEEIQGIPEELLSELSFTDSDKTEFLIQNLIDEYGGIASLDRIILGVYQKTGDIHKRNAMNAKLYRMCQKGMLFSVPSKKGVYSREELTEEDVEKILG